MASLGASNSVHGRWMGCGWIKAEPFNINSSFKNLCNWKCTRQYVKGGRVKRMFQNNGGKSFFARHFCLSHSNKILWQKWLFFTHCLIYDRVESNLVGFLQNDNFTVTLQFWFIKANVFSFSACIRQDQQSRWFKRFSPDTMTATEKDQQTQCQGTHSYFKNVSSGGSGGCADSTFEKRYVPKWKDLPQVRPWLNRHNIRVVSVFCADNNRSYTLPNLYTKFTSMCVT